MTDHELVTRALEAFANPACPSDYEIVDALQSAGVAPMVAERLVALVPLAFGRVLLAHLEELEFSTSAILTAQDGSLKSYDLTSDRIFIAALKMATDMYHEGPRHLFQAGAIVSAEVAVANQVLNSGSSLAGIRFTEPRFLRVSFEEWTCADNL